MVAFFPSSFLSPTNPMLKSHDHGKLALALGFPMKVWLYLRPLVKPFWGLTRQTDWLVPLGSLQLCEEVAGTFSIFPIFLHLMMLFAFVF